MRNLIVALVAAIALLSFLPASAEGEIPSRDERIQAAVSTIIAVQFDEGEYAAIGALQGCYRNLPEGKHTEALEQCLSQDIAYANLSAGMYRTVLKSMKQPEYSSMDAMKVRVFTEARRAGHSQSAAAELLRNIAPVAIEAIGKAIQARRK